MWDAYVCMHMYNTFMYVCMACITCAASAVKNKLIISFGIQKSEIEDVSSFICWVTVIMTNT